MNISKLQNLLGSPLDETPTSRREALQRTGRLGAGLALAALPAAALLPKISFARGGNSSSARLAHGILNYALTLEYLERFFYEIGVESGVIPPEDRPVFELIRDHEIAHVNFLTGVISTLEDPPGDPVVFEADDFDYTAGGLLDPFGSYDDFLLLSMGFEDTGVRAYKGQAPALIGTPYLTAALQIHALEARHAAEVRRVRQVRGIPNGNVAPWIILDDSDAYPDPFAAIYGGTGQFPPEENTVQAGVDLTTFTSPTGDNFTAEEASASFDEPLGMQTVNSVAGLFIVGESA